MADASGVLREHYVDVIYQPTTAADGSVTGIFVEGHDVTKRLIAEAAVSDREERLRLAVDTGRMATWDLDIGSGAITLSAGALSMLGLPADRPFSVAELEASSLPGEFDHMRTALRKAQQRKDPFSRQNSVTSARTMARSAGSSSADAPSSPLRAAPCIASAFSWI